MVLVLFFALLFVFGCTQAERDNSLDPDGVNYAGAVGENSSSSAMPSSSSVEDSSSSSEDSSSSIEVAGESSSSSEMPSSSSVEGSSSSSEGSSSSIVPKYTLEIIVDPAEGGSVSLDPELELYEQGTVVTVKATANAKYAFVGWSGAFVSESKEWFIIMNDNKTLTAKFELIPHYSLETHVNDVYGGTVHYSPSGAIHVSGTVVTVTAEPEFGYEFTGWSGDTTGTANPVTITMDENKELTANFAALPSGTFTDSRDSQEYGWVRIGTQVWMAENLNYAVTGSKCVGESDASGTLVDDGGRCATYGRLYNWETAQGVCPSNWLLSSVADWDKLFGYINSISLYYVAGKFLKAKTGWHNCPGSGSCQDTYGFAALPGGYGRYSDGKFEFVGASGFWWVRSDDSYSAYYQNMNYSVDIVNLDNSRDKKDLLSVRCVQD